MNLLNTLYGTIRVEITTADTADLMGYLSDNDIGLEQVKVHNQLTIQATVNRKDYKKLHALTELHGAKTQMLDCHGIYWRVKGLLKRPVMIISVLFFGLLSAYLPSRVLFVQVEGNELLPERLILERAYQCGIGLGASRKDVRSEQIKNALLESLPQLQWAGVNTHGCVAVISVKEKPKQEITDQCTTGVSSIVAARDGLIMECTVMKGNSLCTVGQAVKAGQTLISGYTDCGLSIVATRAEGEIYALTEHEIQLCTPVNYVKRGCLICTKTEEYLQIGKKLINFDNSSRISDTTCVKIYDKSPVTLPGGFSLPIYRITQTSYYYELLPAQQEDQSAFAWLQDYAAEFLNKQMVAGKILETEDTGELLDQVYFYEAEYACYEMIGRVKEEEIIR